MNAALTHEIEQLENLFWVDQKTLKRISERFREELEEGESIVTLGKICWASLTLLCTGLQQDDSNIASQVALFQNH